MNAVTLTQTLVYLSLLFAVLAFARKLRAFNALPRPSDRSSPKGKPRSGVIYAYTLGMAPWAKESTRLHWAAYLRGVAFHLGIFLGLGMLLVSPWLPGLPLIWRLPLAVALGVGALLGLVGFAARFLERNLKAISSPDDYFSVLLVSLFLAAASLGTADAAFLPACHLIGAVMLVYAPFSKIRHCIYYAYARLFFGNFFGRRAVLPHSQQGAR